LDYAIFDKNLFLIWQRPKKGGEKKPLELRTEPSQNDDKLLSLFDFERSARYFQTAEDILKNVNEKPKK